MRRARMRVRHIMDMRGGCRSKEKRAGGYGGRLCRAGPSVFTERVRGRIHPSSAAMDVCRCMAPALGGAMWEGRRVMRGIEATARSGMNFEVAEVRIHAEQTHSKFMPDRAVGGDSVGHREGVTSRAERRGCARHYKVSCADRAALWRRPLYKCAGWRSACAPRGVGRGARGRRRRSRWGWGCR